MANGQVVDNKGRVLTRPLLFMHLRGAGWATGLFTPDDAARSFEATLASPYLSSLVQYRGIRRASLQTFDTDATDIGVLAPDPRKFISTNVWLIADQSIRDIVTGMAAKQPTQGDTSSLYIVVISQNPIPLVAENINASGYHNRFTSNGRTLHYAVLLNQSAVDLDTIWHYLPGVFSHELVEACTDAEPPTGFLFTDGDELCDLNDTRPVTLPGLGHEIKLSAYWSALDNAAIVPTGYSLKIALNKGPADGVPSVKALINGTSVLTHILANCNS